MKKAVKVWSIRLLSFGCVSLVTIVLGVLYPGMLYAEKTEIGNYTVYHNTALHPEFEQRLHHAHALLQESELYDTSLKLKVCLNDGSVYPALMEKLRGPAFGWGFHDIAVFRGAFNYESNTVQLNGYDWNMEQLMAHELTHCLQFSDLGLLGANPLGKHPHWKWEGYPEYIARKQQANPSLATDIARVKSDRETSPNAWGVAFDDGTIAPRTYYDSWLLVRYSLDVKQMTYRELLQADIPRASIEEELEAWYEKARYKN